MATRPDLSDAARPRHLLAGALVPVILGLVLLGAAVTVSSAFTEGLDALGESLALLLGIPGVGLLLVAVSVAPTWIRGYRLTSKRNGARAFVSAATADLDAARRSVHGETRVAPLPFMFTAVIDEQGLEVWGGWFAYRCLDRFRWSDAVEVRGGAFASGRVGIELVMRGGVSAVPMRFPLYDRGPFGMFVMSKSRAENLAEALRALLPKPGDTAG